tara:strand:+ start:776 stop:1633 length:858 start_codon:yes stop_codon:yes gene_type:complete
MTIKQQGGIFGRNPTFNEITATTSNTDDLYVTDKAGINVTSPSQIPSLTRLQIGSLGSGSDATYSGRLKLDDEPTSLQQGGGLEFMSSTYGSGYGWKISSVSDSGVQLVIGTRQNSADWTEVARFNSSGNLAFPSGKGIDFSATSGTGTSELFSDYEEGSWSPVPFGSTTAGTYTSSYIDGDYVLVGKMCFITCTIAVTSFTGTGNFNISGLPFAAAPVASLGMVQYNTCPFATLTSTNQNLVAQIGTNITFRASSSVAGGGFVTPQCSSSTISYLRVSGCYEVA